MASNIDGKLTAALLEWIGTVTLPSGSIVYMPNVDDVTDPPKAADGRPLPFISLSISRGASITTSLSGGRQSVRQGILQAMVYWPTGEGEVAANDLAGEVISAFLLATVIDTHAGVRVHITGEPYVAGGETGGAYFQLPVIIPWPAFPTT